MAFSLTMRAVIGLAMLAGALSPGTAFAGDAHARKSRGASAAVPAGADVTVDPAMAGRWLPYSTEAYYQLGPLDLQPGTLRFAKGQNFTFTRSAALLRLTPEKKANERGIKALCHGKDMARSVTLALRQQGGQTLLQLAFYAGENGPDTAAGADAQTPPCQTIAYTRAQPLVL